MQNLSWPARAALGLVTLGAGLLPVSSVSAQSGQPPIGVSPDSESAWDIPGWIVVDARDDLSDSEVTALEADLAARVPGVRFSESDLEDQTRIELAELPVASAAALLRAATDDPRVERAEPLAWVQATFVPNDPMFKEQWHMERVGAPSAWDFASGRGVTVAVIDTGVACEDFEGFTKGSDLASTRCVPGWNFIRDNDHANDDHGHGTHVAGTIAQSTNNGIGATGLAFDARLMPIKVLDKGGWGNTADIANGIRWASDHGAQVINLSLGGPRNSKILEEAVAHARAQGTIVVAAAGNSGGAVGFPGGTSGVIGVSATDSDDDLASFSSRGTGVDIGAPGVDVVQQTICESGKNKCEIFPAWKGTSMASPHVAAAAALLVGMGVSDPDAVERTLAEHARVTDSTEAGKKKFGAGILDAASTVRFVAFEQGITRLGLTLLLSIVLLLWTRQKTPNAKLSLGFGLGALFTGPGLLFFAPLVLSRTSLPVDVLARPLADLDFYVGASLHRLLPLATALVPFALLITTLQWKGLQRFVAGVGVGTAAYLGSVVLLHQSYAPIAGKLWLAWCVVNALLSLRIARTALSEAK